VKHFTMIYFLKQPYFIKPLLTQYLFQKKHYGFTIGQTSISNVSTV